MIIVSLSGGMGNQMFQYALGRHLSIKNNVPLALDLTILNDRTPGQGVFRDYDLDLLSVKADFAMPDQVPFQFRYYFTGKLQLFVNKLRARFVHHKGREKKFGTFDPVVLSIGPDAYLEGFWQSEEYFKDIAETIRKDFAVSAPLSKEIVDLRNEIAGCESVCIHVRRTDYVGNSFTGTLENEYYQKGIDYLSNTVIIKKLYVFSDDIEWCRNNLGFNISMMFVGDEYSGEKNVGNFDLMKACRHFILPNSSYSWWAAWLAENPSKVIIAPKRWFAGQDQDTDHIVPSTWVRI